MQNSPKRILPSCFYIKLTGDETQIGRGFSVINIPFIVLEQGNKACLVSGNHSIGIFKVSESDYHGL